MKNHFQKLLFLAALILTNACNLLDQKSPNDILEEDVFTTATGAENALGGLYNSLQSRDYLGGHFQLMPDAYAGLATTGGYDIASLDEFSAQNLTSQNLYLEATYVAIYRSIANANRLLEGIEKIPGSEFEDGRKDRIVAEARFVRAMAHFDLLRWFGYYWDRTSEFGIPIVDHVAGIEEVIPRSSVDEVYKFIIKELEEISPVFDDVEPPLVNYITRATVDALLARVCLYSKDYEPAYNLASSVFSNPAFALFSRDDVPKIYESRGTGESIFELAFDIRNQSGFNALTFGKEDALRPELFFLAAENLKTFFDARPDDIRAQLLDFQNVDESIQPDGRTQKYRGEATRDNPAFVIRLAEMLLIRAETQFRLGAGDAWATLNLLREKRGLDEISPTNPADEDEFFAALLDEVKAEFNFEGQHLFYMVRCGKFESETGLESFRQVFPIPSREIAASNGLIVQNQGY